jgi:putative endonuclease
MLVAMYYVYILKSLNDGSLYKGQTENFEVRLKQHNSGKSDYSSRRGSWKMVYFEEFETRKEALVREKYLKSAAGRKFIRKLNL